MPNNTSTGTAVNDIYGNQHDGEFHGDQAQSGTDAIGNPDYEDLLPNGQYRTGMSGDSVAGGAFTAGFEVVPTGNIIYARPDYVENPLLPSTASNGTVAQPYSVLAPQAAPDALNASTLNNGDPNGGLNSAVNFLSGFNSAFDRAGIGRFARSAFYAASQLSQVGPVVIVALPGTLQRNPITGVVSQATFVLQAPAGSNPVINDGSGSVPFDTSLVMTPGTTLKLENASLFVQNQGSALQVEGGPNPNDRVTFTSYADDSVAGDTNGDGTNTVPQGGNWGGIVLRNFDQAIAGRTDVFPVDGTLQGPNGDPAVSGADDALLNDRVRQHQVRGRPCVPGVARASDTTRSRSTTAGPRSRRGQHHAYGRPRASSQASISGDLDSFREDDTRRSGPLIRRDVVSPNSSNGIWVRPNVDGVVEATDAEVYPTNPVTLSRLRELRLTPPALPVHLAHGDRQRA